MVKTLEGYLNVIFVKNVKDITDLQHQES